MGGIRALMASMSLEGMAILTGVTGVAEVWGREAWVAASRHIISSAVICKSQTIPHPWVTVVMYLSNIVISVALT